MEKVLEIIGEVVIEVLFFSIFAAALVAFLGALTSI